MSSLRVGDRISFSGKTITWEDGRKSPSWCVEEGRTFEILQVDKKSDGTYRVVIGNHRLNDGPITKGTTGAIIVLN